MGSQPSVDYEKFSLELYNISLQNTCVLPDIGIDESLQRYSGLNSTVELQSYSNQLLNSVPGFAEKVGSGLGALTTIPNAVGLGALVISMILEIFIKSETSASEDSYSLLRRVFGEEKASGVRDKMSEYLKRNRMFINDDRQLLEEMRLLEQQLSSQLTILRNSLLHDGQMSSRGLKIWVNGASFHLQMLIHEARLNFRAGNPLPKSVDSINAVIDIYLQDLDSLLKKYKTFKADSGFLEMTGPICAFGPCWSICTITNKETQCSMNRRRPIPDGGDPCDGSEMMNSFMNHVVTKYEPILNLKSHFSNIKYNINFLIIQHDSFTLPSTA